MVSGQIIESKRCKARVKRSSTVELGLSLGGVSQTQVGSGSFEVELGKGVVALKTLANEGKGMLIVAEKVERLNRLNLIPKHARGPAKLI